jgi:AcrR family transcriptional regulator
MTLVPRIWKATIDEHRREVSEAVLDAAASLVAKGGLRSVTMRDIAKTAGIGRATLYKYFDSVEAILFAWHRRQISAHLKQLHALSSAGGPPDERLRAVLEAYALIQHAHPEGDLAAMLHQGKHVERGHGALRELLQGLIRECAKSGSVRSDTSPAVLAEYAVLSLAAAANLGSRAAVSRLVEVIWSGLRGR